MKRLLVVFLGAIFALGLFTGISHAADKIGYIDLSRAFNEYNKTKAYDKTLNDKEKVYTDDRDKKVADLKAFQDKISLLNDKERDAKKDELQSKVKTFQEFDRQKQTELKKEQEEKMKEIMTDIQEAVKKFAEKEAYTIVLNDRVLVYQVKSMDITNQVIEILNKGGK